MHPLLHDTNRPRSSSHPSHSIPARFSPDDTFSRHRVTIKKRYGILPTQLPSKPLCSNEAISTDLLGTASKARPPIPFPLRPMDALRYSNVVWGAPGHRAHRTHRGHLYVPRCSRVVLEYCFPEARTCSALYDNPMTLRAYHR